MKSVLTPVLLFLFATVYGQNSVIQWQNCFGSSEYDLAYSMIRINNGYFVAMEIDNGDEATNYHGGADIWILRLDTSGQIIWEKCYGGSDFDAPYKIVTINDSIFYIYGLTASTDGDVQSTHHGGYDFWIIQINIDGNIIWEKCFGSPGLDEARDFIIDPVHGGYILGNIYSAGGDVSQYFGSLDIWLCNISLEGELLWEKTIGNQYLDNAGSLILTSSDNLKMIASTDADEGMVNCDHTSEFNSDVWILDLNLSGEILSQNCFGGSFIDNGSIIEELDDGLIFAGITNSNNGDVSGYHGSPGTLGFADIWVVRLDANSNILWQRCLGGSEIEFPALITKTNDDKFIMIGETSSNNYDVSGNHSIPNGYDRDIWAVILDENGNLMWQKCLGGWGNDYFFVHHAVDKISDSRYVFAATTNYKSDDITCDIHAQYVKDGWIVELDLSDTVNSFVPQHIREITIHPNPSREYITFQIPVNDAAELVVLTSIGIETAKISFTGGNYTLDVRGYRPGIYYYRIKFQASVAGGKFIVVR